MQPLPHREHRRLDRAHIGENRLLGDRRHHGGIRIEQAVERQGQNDHSAVAEHGRIGADHIGQPSLPGSFSGLGSIHQRLNLHALTP